MICLYHGNCLDGIWSAIVISSKYPDCKTIPVNHSEPCSLEGDKNEEVIIVDFSYPFDELLHLSETYKSVTVIDHHITFEPTHKKIQELQKDNLFSVYNSGRAGCLLAYTYIEPGVVLIPKFLAYVDDRDLWKWDLTHTKSVTAGMKYYLDKVGDKEFIQLGVECLHQYNGEQERKFVEWGSILLATEEAEVERAIARSYVKKTIHGRARFVNAATYQSEIGNACARGVDFAVVYWEDGYNNYKVSLRSLGNFDVSVIAKGYGGGGHKNAAGCVMPDHPCNFMSFHKV